MHRCFGSDGRFQQIRTYLRSISEMTTKSKKKGQKKVQWETGESATQCTGTTWTDIDSQKATNKLMKIWDQERATNYIKARLYGYNVNDADLMSLKSPNWLTDQVLDAYMSYLAQKEWDKGKKVKKNWVYPR